MLSHVRACMRRENRVFIQLTVSIALCLSLRWSEFDLSIKARDNRVIDRALKNAFPTIGISPSRNSVPKEFWLLYTYEIHLQAVFVVGLEFLRRKEWNSLTRHNKRLLLKTCCLQKRKKFITSRNRNATFKSRESISFLPKNYS